MRRYSTIGKVLFNCLLSATAAQAQTALTSANYVTEIVTDYGGYWRSGTGTGANAATNAVKPNSSHNLLAFVLNSGTTTVKGKTVTLTNKYFSTGVNDDMLTTKNLSYVASKYQALPISAFSGTVGSNTKVALGQLYDGVDNGASNPPPASGYEQYLTDGVRGLNLGTGVANLPASTLTFAVDNLVANAIGDGVPDILITQIASPGNSSDYYKLLDASGNQIAGTTTLSANLGNAPVLGQWTIDFYEASKSPMTLGAGFTNTSRDLRLLAVDLSAFGITNSNYGSVKQLQITLSGDSDQAFIAYNTNAATLAPLPVTLVSFTGQAQGMAVQLAWQTASEHHSAHFEVELSANGHDFTTIGQVAAAGTSQQMRNYRFEHQPAQQGLGYYRLRQIDLDGTAHYSPTVAVRTGAAAVEAFPSVFTDHLTVRLPASSAATVALLAPDGRVLHQQQLADAPAQDLALPGAGQLPPGLYLVRVVLDGQAFLRRVVKQ